MGRWSRSRSRSGGVSAFAVLALLPWLLVVACSGGDSTPSTDLTDATPTKGLPALDLPSATLRTAQGARVEGGEGTHCWSGANYRECKEFVAPVTNVEPLVAARGEVLTLDFAQGTPGDLSSGWSRAIGAVPAPVSGARVWNEDQPRSLVSPSGLQIEAPRESGAYLLGVFAKWAGKGDIMYGFYVEVK